MVHVSVFKTCLNILLLVTLTYWSFGGDEQTELGIIKIWSSNFCGVCVCWGWGAVSQNKQVILKVDKYMETTSAMFPGFLLQPRAPAVFVGFVF